MTIRRKVLISCFFAGSTTVLLSLGACTSVNLEDAFPVSAMPPPPVPSATTPQPVFSSPGEYPNLNITPEPSGPQLTDEQSRSATDELRAKRAGLAAGAGQGSAAGSADDLRRIAGSHAQETLRAIEGE